MYVGKVKILGHVELVMLASSETNYCYVMYNQNSWYPSKLHFHGLVQNCSNSSALVTAVLH